MFIATVVVAVVLALMMGMSARMKLVRDPRVLDQICDTCDVPTSWLPRLAVIELMAIVGVLLGLAVAPLGITAGGGIILYMVCAAIAHVRVRDWHGIGNPLILLVAAAVYLALRIASS